METDPLYQQGLKHFGSGEWAEAVACFTQLQVNYPDDPRVAQFLESAQLRGAMGTGLERGVRSRVRLGWLQRLALLGLVVVLLAVAGAVYWAYQSWVIPARAEAARQEHIGALRQSAQVSMASGLYAKAIETYEGILAEVPGDPAALSGIERAQRLEQASALYTQAMEAMEAGDQAEALRLLEEIKELEEDYRNTTGLIEQIKATQALSREYDEALNLYQAEDWLAATQAFELLRTDNPDFKPKETREYLYEAYIKLADQQLEQATTVAAVEVADEYYQKALSLNPADPQIREARSLARLFAEGAEAYQAGDWEDAIRKLSALYEQKPGYFGGRAVTWLFEAFMTTGQAFMAQDDPFAARERFARAVAVAVTEAQRAEAQEQYDIADRLTTPTPTIIPTRTPWPTPTPLPAGWVAPSWTRRPTGTPEPYPFILVETTYMPNMLTGHGCEWAGVAGRLFDRRGAPLTEPKIGIWVRGPEDVAVVSGEQPLIGPSGWLVQWDAQPKVLKGEVQLYYKDQPVSGPIQFATRGTCFENMLILDIQQVKPLPE